MKDSQPKAIKLKDYRCPDFLIDQTHLRFQLYEKGARVTSKLSIRRNPDARSFKNVLELDGVNLTLEHIALDGRELQSSDYILGVDKLTLERLPGKFELSVVTWILPQENTCLEGLYRSSSMFCTQCEAEGFRRITYYLDRPDVMSVFTTTVEADKTKYPVLLSNGNPVEQGDIGDRHWVTWQDPYKKPCYLFALVAGDLQFVESVFQTMSGRQVNLRIYVEPHDLEKCDHAMESLKRAMKWDEKVYGREYDLDIFNIVAVSDFNMGAMENKGLNIFNSSCVLANAETATDNAFQRVEAIVAHEYFHNWSGNRVTCRDWFQLSLKEGFTVFRDAEFSADMHSRAVKRIEDVTLLRANQFAEDAGPMAHPVRPDSYIEIANFYTLTVYEKGAEVVRMIHTLVGEDKFRKGSDLYFSRHDGQAVTTDDFVRCMEEASGIDLSLFKHWYNQAGTPRVEIRDEYDQARQQYSLQIEQSCPPSPGQAAKKPYLIPLRVGLLGENGQDLSFQLTEKSAHLLTETVLEITQAKQSFTFCKVAEKPVPSLFRGFSAPVKASFPYSREQLRFLATYDGDGFNRWDAGQRLALSVLDEMTQAYQNNQPMLVDEILIAAFGDVLNDNSADHAMLAKLTTLPTVSVLAERAELIDVDAILAAREELTTVLVQRHTELIKSRYRTLTELLAEQTLDMGRMNLTGMDIDGTDTGGLNTGGTDVCATNIASTAAMGLRAHRNACLALLANGKSESVAGLARSQLKGAANMTDELGAVQALVASGDDVAAQQAVDCFHDKWLQDSLVMDSWFSVQASCSSYGSLDRVGQLTRHSLFSEKNPNKVRAVIGAFAGQNWKHFHNADGSGYQFLKDWVLVLDKINPQIAARLIIPMTRWKKLAGSRSEQLQHCLVQIKQHSDLSKDVYEVVMKSLR